MVRGVQKAYESGDVDKIAELTFEPLVMAAGGAEAYKAISSRGIEQHRRAGLVVESQTVGTPTALVVAGDYELSFVPTESIMHVAGKRGRSLGFMVAARRSGATNWQLIDGAGLRKNPQMLKVPFPGLPEGLVLPENKLELLPVAAK